VRMVRGADGEEFPPLGSPSYLPVDEARSRKSKAPGHVSGAGDPDPHPSRNLNRVPLAEELKGCLVQRQLIVDDCHIQSLAQTTRS
jgi:hypothetical protein